MEWKEALLSEFLEFNPKRTIKKNEVARKITMDLLIPHSKQIYSFKYEPYTGGAKFSNGDTIMARITPCLENGKHAYVSCLNEGEIAYGSTEYIVLCGKNGVSDNEFVYYLSHTPQFVNTAIKSMVGSSGRQRAQVPVLENLIISVPVNLSDQRKIAGILSALDAKIENNNKINANLEAQAQALFKSWFVDFTPFKDQPFVDSELGPIPQGWKVGKYEDIILDTLAGDWGKEKITGNYTHEVACVRGCDFQDMNNGYRGNTPQRYILEKNYSTKRLLPQDLIIEISGGTLTVSTGRACLVSKEMLEKYDNNLVCTNFCKVIRPIDGYSAYCYYSWLHKYNNRVMFGYENGSSGLKNFRFKDFLTKEPLLIPPKADLIKFQHIIKLLQQKKQTNGTESTKLAALRDTLLPKLMSGEIDLDKIEI